MRKKTQATRIETPGNPIGEYRETHPSYTTAVFTVASSDSRGKLIVISHTTRFAVIENKLNTSTAAGQKGMIVFNAMFRGEPFPTLIAVSGFLVEQFPKDWILGHLQVSEQGKRQGFATEVIEFIEKKHGYFRAIWCTPSGRAFSKAYQKKHGERAGWDISLPPEIQKIVNKLV